MPSQMTARGFAVGIFAVLSLVPGAAVAIHHLCLSLYPTNDLLTAPVGMAGPVQQGFPEPIRAMVHRSRPTDFASAVD